VSRNWPTFALAWLGFALGRIALAQSLPDALRACHAEMDIARRVTCYDRVTASLDKPTDGPNSTASPATTQTAASGAETPGTKDRSAAAEFGVREGPLDAKKQTAAPRQISAVITRIERRPRGELVMTLDNGQVWAQIEPPEYFPLQVGDRVQISAAWLGSYLLLAPSKRSTRVSRIQ
jgi:hypothetical protein